MRVIKDSLFSGLDLWDWIGILCVFLFIFSFYLVGPINSSMLVGAVFFPYLLQRKNRGVKALLSSGYIKSVGFLLLLVIFFCFVYSNIIHFTGEMNYAKIMFGQFVQYILALVLLAFLISKKRIARVEDYIIIAYFIQSVIELVALFVPSFAVALLPFSRAEEIYEGYGGVRALALSSGVGWNLALSFGLVYILIAKRILCTKTANVLDYIVYILIVVGTFFAGRTGFVGLLYAGLFVVFYKRLNLIYILRLALLIVALCAAIYFVAVSIPGVYDIFNDKVFRFAFEWYYSMEETGEASTGSTDVLMDMWKTLPSFRQFWIGDGWFYNPSGDGYYKGVDVGILRNLFYWGIGGYLLVISYQIKQLSPLWKNGGVYRLMGIMILLYFFTMELKAMTIGHNKMTFSIVILVVSSYVYRFSIGQNRICRRCD